MERSIVVCLCVALVLVAAEAQTDNKYDFLPGFIPEHMLDGTLGILTSGACTEPKEIGPCKAAFPRWYFDTKTSTCKKFYWGGCKANGNNFSSWKKCMKKCLKCDAPLKIGPCKAAFQRYYYDAEEKTCKKFLWGGCSANGNNFPTLKKCQKKCEK